jgi:hypothetical protein
MARKAATAANAAVALPIAIEEPARCYGDSSLIPDFYTSHADAMQKRCLPLLDPPRDVS